MGVRWNVSKRLEILKVSLLKKERLFNDKIANHIATVKEANGQPLNDKGAKGRATLNKWEKQNDAIRTIQKSIEVTKQAIEKEEWKIKGVKTALDILPSEILALIETKELIQWRKYPNMFFVSGVDKARIIWDNKTKKVAYKYASEIPNDEQFQKFRTVYNALNTKLNG